MVLNGWQPRSAAHLLTAVIYRAGFAHTAIALEASQALSLMPAARLVMTSASPSHCAPSPVHSKQPHGSARRSTAISSSSRSAEQSALALLRTAASELGGQHSVTFHTADGWRPQSLRSSAPPTAIRASTLVPGLFAAQAIRSGAMALPLLKSGREPVADAELCQIQSLQPGSLDSLAAVHLSWCVKATAVRMSDLHAARFSVFNVQTGPGPAVDAAVSEQGAMAAGQAVHD